MVKILTQICFLIVVGVIFASQYGPEVKIDQGTLRGVHRETWKGKKFSAFLGIPYAKPPVGDLRFKHAVPADSWDGVLDASKIGADCPQIDIFLNDYTVRGDEDCLYLNIYTPQLSDSSKKPPLPVMFYIHGGGFMSGSGNPAVYGPDILLDKDVVLVTINYRLGALGFLSTEDDYLPGNNGLKDQSFALKWAKKNIAHFGGDPKRITIFGQSAGGASTHYQVLSPLSKGYFNGAIAHSGSALATWALAAKGKAVGNAKRLAEFLKCPTSSNQEMIECLSKVDAYDIVNQDTKFMEYGYHPCIPFKPVIEPNIEGAFITEHPVDIIKSGKASDVPFITGFTTEDGGIISTALYNFSNLIEELNKDYQRIAPIIFMLDDSITNKHEISKKIREFYIGQRNFDESTKSELTDLFTDAYFLAPQNAAAQLHARHYKAPVYTFLFGYRGTVSYGPLFGDPDYDYGVCHGDDLIYLLSCEVLFPDYKPNTSEKKITDIMSTLWANFAETGNPTPNTDSLITTKWQPVKDEKLSYYFIKNENDIKMAEGLFREREEFWKNLPTDSHRIKIRDEL